MLSSLTFSVGRAANCSRGWTALVVVLAAASFSITAYSQDQQKVSVEVSADRDSLYVNEVFHLKISVRALDVSLDKSMQVDSVPPGDRLKMGEFKELTGEQKTENGRYVEVRRFRCEARALASGKLEIAPVISGTMVDRRGVFQIMQPFRAQAPALILNVSALPATNRPSDFSGAVGNISFTAGIQTNDIAVGDLIKVAVTIGGTGYIDSVSMPLIQAGPHFKVYDSRLLTNDSARNIASLEQVLVPLDTNACEIPTLRFSYFDPYVQSYRTVVQGPFKFTFHPPKSTVVQGYSPGQTTNAGDGTAASVPRARSHRLFAGKAEAIIREQQRAFFAPSQSSIVLFDIPANSLVEIVEKSGDWSEIQLGNKRGWMSSSALGQ